MVFARGGLVLERRLSFRKHVSLSWARGLQLRAIVVPPMCINTQAIFVCVNTYKEMCIYKVYVYVKCLIFLSSRADCTLRSASATLPYHLHMGRNTQVIFFVFKYIQCGVHIRGVHLREVSYLFERAVCDSAPLLCHLHVCRNTSDLVFVFYYIQWGVHIRGVH